jgi:hypothetical protein
LPLLLPLLLDALDSQRNVIADEWTAGVAAR